MDQKSVKRPSFSIRQAGHNFCVISRDALADSRLSYLARGILSYCLSQSRDFTFDSKWIVDNGKEDKDSVVEALKELRALGYLITLAESPESPGMRYEFRDVPDSEAADSPRALISLPPVDPSPEPPPVPAVVQPPTLPSMVRLPRPRQGLDLPEWLEPYRGEMESWQANRKRRHPKLPPGITKISMSGLKHAKEAGVLKEFCEYAAESTWQSLGFPGYKEYIDKLVQDKLGKRARTQQMMAPINYTLG